MKITNIVASTSDLAQFTGSGSVALLDDIHPGRMHSVAAVVVWRMEGETRSLYCEARARQMAASDDMLMALYEARDLIMDRWGYPADASGRARVLEQITKAIVKADPPLFRHKKETRP